MRVVLDTSTLIAAFISRAGVCAELVEDVLLHHELIISEYILDELARTLKRKFGYSEADVRSVGRFLRGSSTLVEPVVLPADSCRDPNDIPVLGTAVAGSADLLVTGDLDLLTLQRFRDVAIVRPAEFWQRTIG